MRLAYRIERQLGLPHSLESLALRYCEVSVTALEIWYYIFKIFTKCGCMNALYIIINSNGYGYKKLGLNAGISGNY